MKAYSTSGIWGIKNFYGGYKKYVLDGAVAVGVRYRQGRRERNAARENIKMTEKEYFDFIDFKRWSEARRTRAWYAMYKAHADEIRQIRRRIKCDNSAVVYIMERGKMNEIDRGQWCISRYKWSGSKRDLIKHLWKEFATTCERDYTPTGLPFTAEFKVAHIAGDEWKIAELIKIDC